MASDRNAVGIRVVSDFPTAVIFQTEVEPQRKHLTAYASGSDGALGFSTRLNPSSRDRVSFSDLPYISANLIKSPFPQDGPNI
jgi:hypothetical protein